VKKYLTCRSPAVRKSKMKVRSVSFAVFTILEFRRLEGY